MRLIFIIVIHALFTSALYAEECHDVFKRNIQLSRSFNNLEQDQSYIIQFQSSSKLRKGVFLRFSPSDSDKLIMQFESRDEIVEQAIHKKEIFGLRKITKSSKRNNSFIKEVFRNPLLINPDQILEKKIKLFPYRSLARGARVEVKGDLFSSKSKAVELINSLEALDKSFEGTKLLIPTKTQIIFNDKGYIPSLNEPSAYVLERKNIWEDERSRIIFMTPIDGNSMTATDLGILYHERAHTLLFETFSSNSYINTNMMLQEAFADFFAINFTNKPSDYGKVVNDNRYPLRDISTMNLSYEGEHIRLDSLAQISANKYHQNSVFISNILWRVSRFIPPMERVNFFVELIRDLNIHAYQFRDVKNKLWRKYGQDKYSLAVLDIEYLLIMVSRKVKNMVFGKDVNRVLKDYMSELGMSEESLAELKGEIEPLFKSNE